MKRRLFIEISHFKALSEHGQKLLMSIGIYNIADPLLWTFVSAYLWREYGSMHIVALYNAMAFTGLPIGFYLNGLLLNRYSHKNLYLFGSVLQGLIVTILLFMPGTPIPVVLVFGMLFGIGSGFFWSNRNFLSIYVTNSANRIYFTSLDTITGNIAKITVPFLIGWFIVLGSKIHLYSEQTAYQILAIVLLFLLFLCGLTVRSIKFQQKSIDRIRLQNTSKLWNQFRLFTSIGGMYGGIAIFVSVLMVLKFLGNEESLGTIQSFAAVLSTLAIYIVARKAQIKHRIYIMALGIGMAVAASLAFGILFSGTGVIIYYLLSAPSFPFRWVSEAPLGYDVIDHEEHHNSGHHYSFILDQEFFVNVGRVTAIMCFLSISSISSDAALRYGLIIVAFLQVIRLFIARHLENELHLSKMRMQEQIQDVIPEIK